MTKDEALKLALEKFEFMNHVDSIFANEFDFQINAIKEALAQPEQEPVAFEKTVCPFCTSEWVTAEQHDRNVDRVEQEPVAITITGKLGNIYSFTGDYSLKKGDKVYTSPPQRKPLTEDEVVKMDEWLFDQPFWRVLMLVRAIEAEHGIKGEA